MFFELSLKFVKKHRSKNFKVRLTNLGNFPNETSFSHRRSLLSQFKTKNRISLHQEYKLVLRRRHTSTFAGVSGFGHYSAPIEQFGTSDVTPHLVQLNSSFRQTRQIKVCRSKRFFVRHLTSVVGNVVWT